MFEREFAVGAAEAGERLDRFLVSRLPEISRNRLQTWVRAGSVTVNGEAVKPGAALRLGDTIRMEVLETDPEPPRLDPEPIPLDILHEDDDLIVINKPAGMVVHPGAGNWSGTVANALAHHLGRSGGDGDAQSLRAGIVHRLDKDTSGVMALARHASAQTALARAFAGRQVDKYYLAIVEGRPRQPQGVINFPVRRHPVHRKRMQSGEGVDGRQAETLYRVLCGSLTASLVECRLMTGRTHQIRVHFKAIGHPLLGDALYNPRRADRHPRQMLHAWKLAVPHPSTGEILNFHVHPPADFMDTLPVEWNPSK